MSRCYWAILAAIICSFDCLAQNTFVERALLVDTSDVFNWETFQDIGITVETIYPDPEDTSVVAVRFNKLFTIDEKLPDERFKILKPLIASFFEFRRGLFYRNVEVYRSMDFSNASILWDAKFERTAFQGIVDFNALVCEGKVLFTQKTKFKRPVDFTGAIFKGPLYFKTVAFDSLVDFSDATFDSSLTISKCSIGGDLIFDRAYMPDRLIIDDVSVSGKIILSKARRRDGEPPCFLEINLAAEEIKKLDFEYNSKFQIVPPKNVSTERVNSIMKQLIEMFEEQKLEQSFIRLDLENNRRIAEQDGAMAILWNEVLLVFSRHGHERWRIFVITLILFVLFWCYGFLRLKHLITTCYPKEFVLLALFGDRQTDPYRANWSSVSIYKKLAASGILTGFIFFGPFQRSKIQDAGLCFAWVLATWCSGKACMVFIGHFVVKEFF